MTPRKKDIEANEEKKRTILLAAERVIAKKGAMGVTMKSVAAEAKVSHGLLHYYFANKDEMMLDMIRYNTKRFLDAFSEIFSNAKPGHDIPKIITQSYRMMHKSNPDLFNIFMECLPLLWTTKTMEKGFIEIFIEFRKSIEAFTEQLVIQDIIKLKMSIRETAIMLCALSDGVELQLRIRPNFIDDDSFWDAYEVTLRSLLNV